jgi:hypothetical protein
VTKIYIPDISSKLDLKNKKRTFFMTAAIGGSIVGQVVSTAINGTIRVPALMTALASVTIASELVFRGLGTTLSVVGLEPKHDSWVEKLGGHINQVRPYKNQNQYPTHILARNFVITTLVAIATTELARVLAGPAPSWYNNVLAFMGPIRLDSSSYLEGVTQVLDRTGLR